MKNIFCFDQLVQNNRKYLDDCATKQSSYHSLFTVKYTSLTTITTGILPWDDMVCLFRLNPAGRRVRNKHYFCKSIRASDAITTRVKRIEKSWKPNNFNHDSNYLILVSELFTPVSPHVSLICIGFTNSFTIRRYNKHSRLYLKKSPNTSEFVSRLRVVFSTRFSVFRNAVKVWYLRLGYLSYITT